MTSGIYKIKSLKCGKCYWGSSKNIYNRFATHRYCLNKKSTEIKHYKVFMMNMD